MIIAHMNKMRDTNPLYRTNGSIDIAGAARSILAITRTANKEAPAERYLVQVKSNLAPTGSAILFEVAESGVNFVSELEMTAEEAFSSLAPKMGRPSKKELKAKEFILEMLKDGEMLANDCEANVLESLPSRLSACEKALATLKEQMENAKAEVEKPFEQEQELSEKAARLAELNALLNMDKRENAALDAEPEHTEIETVKASCKER